MSKENLNELDSLVLLKRGIKKVREHYTSSQSELLPICCIICVEDVLITHTIEGNGDVCCDCASQNKISKPYPWAKEFTILHKRGLNFIKE